MRYNKKHGLIVKNKPHPLYRLWYLIKTRCYNSSPHNFPYYQGKGIKVCDEWLNNVMNFYNWAISNGWKKGLSIDRIDSSKDYCPENCRFISLSENSKKSCVFSCSSKSHNKKSRLSAETLDNIRFKLCNGIKNIEIAKEFGLDPSYVSKIKLNKRLIKYKPQLEVKPCSTNKVVCSC